MILDDKESGLPWIDISVPIRPAMVHWPGDPPVQINRLTDIEHGDDYNLSQIIMGTHTGTHLDAPCHFIPQGDGIDQMPLAATVGRARVIEIEDTKSVKTAELKRHHIRRGERVLFKTRNSTRCWQTDSFIEDFVFISPEAAFFLVEQGVRMVGIDYLSVGDFITGGAETHQNLLQGGVWIIEGLDLSHVSPGHYELICLPIKIEGSDGAPARAILRPVVTGASPPKA